MDVLALAWMFSSAVVIESHRRKMKFKLSAEFLWISNNFNPTIHTQEGIQAMRHFGSIFFPP